MFEMMMLACLGVFLVAFHLARDRSLYEEARLLPFEDSVWNLYSAKHCWNCFVTKKQKKKDGNVTVNSAGDDSCPGCPSSRPKELLGSPAEKEGSVGRCFRWSVNDYRPNWQDAGGFSVIGERTAEGTAELPVV